MNFNNINNIVLDSWHSYIPEKKIDTYDLLKKFKIFSFFSKFTKRELNYNFIKKKIGINKLHYYDNDRHLLEKSLETSKIALEKSSFDVDDVGIIIFISTSLKIVEPSKASFLGNYLGVKPFCQTYDIGNACFSQFNAINIISNLINLGKIKCGIITSAENTKDAINSIIKDGNNHLNPSKLQNQLIGLTIGSGTTSIIIGDKKYSQQGYSIESIGFTSNLSHYNDCFAHSQEIPVKCNAKNQILGMSDLFNDLAKIIKNMDFDYIIPHQIGISGEKTLKKRLYNIFPEKKINILKSYDTNGNMTHSAIIYAFIKSLDDGCDIKSPLFLFAGAGLNLGYVKMNFHGDIVNKSSKKIKTNNIILQKLKLSHPNKRISFNIIIVLIHMFTYSRLLLPKKKFNKLKSEYLFVLTAVSYIQKNSYDKLYSKDYLLNGALNGILLYTYINAKKREVPEYYRNKFKLSHSKMKVLSMLLYSTIFLSTQKLNKIIFNDIPIS